MVERNATRRAELIDECDIRIINTLLRRIKVWLEASSYKMSTHEKQTSFSAWTALQCLQAD
jgi:chorismate mutase